MRLLVVSDTHGQAPLPLIADLARDCDLMVHLGDGFNDGQKLSLMQPTPIIQVLGNSDLPLSVVPEKLIELEGWTVLLTHGHRYGVKRSLVDLIGHADEQGAQLVLFGHVHRRHWETAGRVKAFCPSSAAYNYDGTPPSVGILEITKRRITHGWVALK